MKIKYPPDRFEGHTGDPARSNAGTFFQQKSMPGNFPGRNLSFSADIILDVISDDIVPDVCDDKPHIMSDWAIITNRLHSIPYRG